MEEMVTYIKPELLVLIPVLYFAGMGLKKSQAVADKQIPLWLGAGGVVLAVLWVLATSVLKSWQDALMAVFVAVTQGVLSAGCSVYVNQIVKQAGKGDK